MLDELALQGMQLVAICHTLDGLDLAQCSAALVALEQKAGSEVQGADDLAGHDHAAAQRAAGVQGVAQVAILALVGHVQDAFQHHGVRTGATMPLRVRLRMALGIAVVVPIMPGALVLAMRVLLALAALRRR